MGRTTRIPVRCVGGIAHDQHGSLLLIRRANDPGRGLWSLPGGRVEEGESDIEAVIREMAEETGLIVIPGTLAGTVVRGPYEIHDYRCTVRGGELRAGDDAAAARWVDAAEYAALDRDGRLVTGLTDCLAGWRLLPG
ncbi:NUDIX hydrolase [Amycolatopsis nigrescens]|uniref:NUDIX hydrolase n=1 Tax=Amycolatopsis nigrescens TaxID=381445 RepID=UPI0004757CEA|nr:NUDIX domain-containing protein [Amycolatopsis nigrescens]